MARLFTSGGETKHWMSEGYTSQTTGTGCTVTYDTGTKRSGGVVSTKYLIGATAAQTCYNQFTHAGVAARTYWIRFWFNVTQVPSTGLSRIWEIRQASGGILQFTHDASGDVWYLADASSGTQIGSTYTATHGNWHLAEIQWNMPASGSGTFSLKINGTLVTDAASYATTYQGPHTMWRIGRPGNPQNTTVYFDDVAFNDNQGAAQTSWPGDGYVWFLNAVSDTTLNSWTGGAGGTSTVYEGFNNQPPVGVAIANATDAAQVKNLSASANTGTWTTETYNTQIPAAHSITLLFASLCSCASFATVNGSLQVSSNPTDGGAQALNFYYGSTSGGVFPTNWKYANTQGLGGSSPTDRICYAPSVTRSSGIQIQMTKTTANASRNPHVCSFGVIVESVIVAVTYERALSGISAATKAIGVERALSGISAALKALGLERALSGVSASIAVPLTTYERALSGISGAMKALGLERPLVSVSAATKALGLERPLSGGSSAIKALGLERPVVSVSASISEHISQSSGSIRVLLLKQYTRSMTGVSAALSLSGIERALSGISASVAVPTVTYERTLSGVSASVAVQQARSLSGISSGIAAFGIERPLSGVTATIGTAGIERAISGVSAALKQTGVERAISGSSAALKQTGIDRTLVGISGSVVATLPHSITGVSAALKGIDVSRALSGVSATFKALGVQRPLSGIVAAIGQGGIERAISGVSVALKAEGVARSVSGVSLALKALGVERSLSGISGAVKQSRIERSIMGVSGSLLQTLTRPLSGISSSVQMTLTRPIVGVTSSAAQRNERAATGITGAYSAIGVSRSLTGILAAIGVAGLTRPVAGVSAAICLPVTLAYRQMIVPSPRGTVEAVSARGTIEGVSPRGTVEAVSARGHMEVLSPRGRIELMED